MFKIKKKIHISTHLDSKLEKTIANLSDLFLLKKLMFFFVVFFN